MKKEEFYTKWIETFGCNISKSDIKNYVKSTGNFIWHIFSWELLNENQYLTGKDAKEAYDRVDKSGAVYIEWFKDKNTKDLVNDLNTAKALDEFVEVYVVGKNFSWTYIKTHEEVCGPYFMMCK